MTLAGVSFLVFLPLVVVCYPPDYHYGRYEQRPVIPRHTHTAFVQYNCGPLARIDCSYNSDHVPRRSGPEYHGNHVFHGPPPRSYPRPYHPPIPHDRPYPSHFHSHDYPHRHDFFHSQERPVAHVDEDLHEAPLSLEDSDPEKSAHEGDASHEEPHTHELEPVERKPGLYGSDFNNHHGFGFAHPHGFHFSDLNFKPFAKSHKRVHGKLRKPHKAPKEPVEEPVKHLMDDEDEVAYLGPPVASFGPNYALEGDPKAGSEVYPADGDTPPSPAEPHKEPAKVAAEEAGGPEDPESTIEPLVQE